MDDSQNVIGDATNIQPDLADAGEPSYELSYLEGEESTEAVETIENGAGQRTRTWRGRRGDA
ncbi:MAG: hypothetical protein HND48_14805 [Chloroflexi bacterium]|nr:hypothetical protein [Chloroflexota bacterium]